MAIHDAINTKITKSLLSNCHKLETDAPRIFLTPISLVRCSAINEANPKSPKQEIKIARMEKNAASLPIRSSVANLLL